MVRLNILMVAVSAACLAAPCASALAAETVAKITPARVDATLDAKIKKVTLTPKAAERLGIQIDEVRADPSGDGSCHSIRSYDLTGKTWVYVSADPLTFVRGAVEIDTIKGDNVYLSDGPPTGTKSARGRSAASLRRRGEVGH